MSKTLEEFDVEEQPSSVLEEKYPNLKVIHSAVRVLRAKQHVSQIILCMYMSGALDRYYIIINFGNFFFFIQST